MARIQLTLEVEQAQVLARVLAGDDVISGQEREVLADVLGCLTETLIEVEAVPRD